MATAHLCRIQDWRVEQPQTPEPPLSDTQKLPWEIRLATAGSNVTIEAIDPVNGPESPHDQSKSILIEVDKGALVIYVAPLEGENLVNLRIMGDTAYVEPNGPHAATVEDGRITVIGPDEVPEENPLTPDPDPALRASPRTKAPNEAQKGLLKVYPGIDELCLPEDEGEIDDAVNSHRGVGDTLFTFLWRELGECDDPRRSGERAIEELGTVLEGMPEGEG